MDSFQLTPRQLLVLVLTACRDAGFEEVPRQLVINALYELRTFDCPPVPKLAFMLSSMKRFNLDLERAFDELGAAGAVVSNPNGDLVIGENCSTGEIYKRIPYEDRRLALEEALAPYASEFVRQVVLIMNHAHAPQRDPRLV